MLAAATPPVVVEAPAKINLYLHVVGRRADGYHLLDSLAVFAGIGDTIEAAPAEALTLSIDGPFARELGNEEDNLVLRAAHALAAASGRPAAARIRLTKRLPVASGIGGGSADAAATLHALARLWRLDFEPAALAAIGLALGADVPVCVYGRSAFFAGIGEVVTPAPTLPPAWLVLVNPGIALPTPRVFKARSGGFSGPGRFAAGPADAAELAAVLKLRGNDLTEAAVHLAPVIGTVLAELEALPGALLTRMSGSGATCFALFAEQAAAETAAENLRTRQPGWWGAAAPLLANAPPTG
ncbi:4-diphosphocytidyl-2-C-methyl-D-erythritol kinase [uncultured Defluviicoccus sp.]|uniref:4-(cytidine 5'-diphospho)-2-C-methyl-D-erythritol kinase n=1 Tax=metagenome TaxID=256318 RepID=A0A380TH76_9ZZZZ|nr:4-diphosphocytidyl-2-C-methyl-D-erythritol kinase [uncultured Defluviicoccus sp.]